MGTKCYEDDRTCASTHRRMVKHVHGIACNRLKQKFLAHETYTSNLRNYVARHCDRFQCP